MIDAGGNTHAKFVRLLRVENVTIQVVVQRTENVILGNQPQLSGRISRRHVRSEVSQNVGMANGHRTKNKTTFAVILKRRECRRDRSSRRNVKIILYSNVKGAM